MVEPILKKHKVAKPAVENHKDRRAPELGVIDEKLSSEHVGVTLDFGNSIALMEQPMSVIETLVPYVVSTHVKDMAVDEYENDSCYLKSCSAKVFSISTRSLRCVLRIIRM